MEKRAKDGEGGNFKVGNYGSPADYVKKYLIKNLREILGEGMKNSEHTAELSKNGKDPPTEEREESAELKLVDDKRRKERKRKDSWGSKVKFEDNEKRRKLIGSIKMGWYWLTRTPFYTVSPVFRRPKPKREKKGWVFLGAWKVNDLDMLFWLERKYGECFIPA